MESSGARCTNCPFELPTYQRRLRHLRSVAIRNLVCPKYNAKDVSKLQSYFTLHKDKDTRAFYTSEKITGSLNPSWQSFDISRYEGEIDTKSQFFVVRVWVGVDTDKLLLMDWQAHLTGLMFFADKLQQDSLKKHQANTVIFGMFDKFFVAPVIQEPTPLNKARELVLPVENAIPKNSYNSSSLQRIHMVLRAIKQTQLSVGKVHRSIKDKLLSSQEKSQKLSSREALLLKVEQLRNELTWKTAKLQASQEECEKISEGTKKSRKGLEEMFSLLGKEKDHLSDRKKTYNQTRESLIKENAQLWIRRKQLIGELASNIYPIVENKKQEMSICEVKLPNSENFQGHDDVKIAVALGYICHMLSMISDILDIPLRYPTEHRGSRSLIKDHVHTKLTEKDREFPLYSKGKEKFQFNYGVFLLNKNISQMRFFCGLGTTDLRTTLVNIKSLLESKLGVRSETAYLMPITPGSNGRDRSLDFDKTDTHSSAASGGRFSFPDSDMVAHRNHDNGSDNSLTEYSGKRQEGDETEDIFHPSDDNFFKISNPVSEQLELFNDFNNVIPESSSESSSQHQNFSFSEEERLRDLNSTMVENKFNTFSGDRLHTQILSDGDNNSLTEKTQGENNDSSVDTTGTNTNSEHRTDTVVTCDSHSESSNKGDNAETVNSHSKSPDVGVNSEISIPPVISEVVINQDAVNSNPESSDRGLNSETDDNNVSVQTNVEEDKSQNIPNENSDDQDLSFNCRSFKTSALKQANDLVTGQECDTKSFESIENSPSENVLKGGC